MKIAGEIVWLMLMIFIAIRGVWGIRVLNTLGERGFEEVRTTGELPLWFIKGINPWFWINPKWWFFWSADSIEKVLKQRYLNR